MSNTEKMCDCNQGRLPCTCKPYEQHQGEPAALPARKPWSGLLATAENLRGEGWNSCLDAIAKLGPLYTHPDADEVERLRADYEHAFSSGEAARTECDTLRGQLAELEGLLREALEFVDSFKSNLGFDRASCDKYGEVVWDRIQSLQDRALTCQTPTGCACPGDGVSRCKRCPSASAEPSAPVERAEFQREGRYIIIKLGDLAKVPAAVVEPFAEQLTAIQRRLPSRQYVVVESDWPEYEPTWAAIQARAALERKP